MQRQSLINFIFTIRTKNGVVVKDLQILAANQSAAEKQLFQMYRNCKILSVKKQSQQTATTNSFESVLDIISSH